VTRQITTEWEHLAVGEVKEGQFLKRVGLKIVGAEVSAVGGAKGDKGDPGDPGQDGADGLSAYQIAVAGGFVGTEAEWILSLKGEQGDPGPQGDPGQSVGGEAFPVGSVFIAVVNTNPGTLLGYGTWSSFAAGRVLVGLDAGQTEFDTVEETGGAKTHTLTTAEMPSHTHVQDAHTHVQNAHSHVITSQTATTGSATSYEHGTLDTSSAETEATETTATTTAVNQNATAVNQSTGGGGAHNNLQPYIVVYMWKRTA
jgi:microcystin-dependent protein